VIEGPDRQFFGADDIIRIVHDHQQVSSRWEFEEVATQGTAMRRNPRHSPAFAANDLAKTRFVIQAAVEMPPTAPGRSPKGFR
jgi:hypothetical protein